MPLRLIQIFVHERHSLAMAMRRCPGTVSTR
nr:MAG TPA: hypothetical protein [Caudoviricetes sp.]